MSTTIASSPAHWIDGTWKEGARERLFEVIDPSTEEVIGAVPAGTAEDVDLAVKAAGRAIGEWSTSSLADRIGFLERWHAELERNGEELAEGITEEVGTPITAARAAQVGIALAILRSYADEASNASFEERIGNSLVAREPAGVAACITPWNLPLIIAMQKLPAALVAGCTVVLKPSEITPLNARALVESAARAGLPPGVLNVVFGDGPTVGEALVGHPGVDVVSFTGSTRAGRRVAQVAAETVKKVHLELGGKNASVILDDADLEPAIRACVDQSFFNGGQSCIVWSRMLVPRARLDEAAELAGIVADGYRIGPPRDPDTDLGPLVSEAARDRVGGYIRKGVDEGARLVIGGPEAPERLERGYYVRPTVFSDVTRDMTIAREEIFGPVLSIIPYGNEAEAVEIANDTIYGLHGSVWSGDEEHALSVARRLRTGRVDINGGPFNLIAPFGGYKQSGVGRELGRFGIDEFLELKSVQLPGDVAASVGVGARRTAG
jgi:acyl-CoA reductase-like NAD-dependent aldehyde dehydrogenase